MRKMLLVFTTLV